MSAASASPAGRLAALLIRGACRRLPAGARDERRREWAAELPAILHDPQTAVAVRPVRALAYAAGIWWCAGARLDGRSDAGRAGSAVRLFARGAGIYIGVVVATAGLIVEAGPERLWMVALTAVACLCLDVFCLADLTLAGRVRYLPRWAWVLVCLAQCPLGGILYLSAGRVRSLPR